MSLVPGRFAVATGLALATALVAAPAAAGASSVTTQEPAHVDQWWYDAMGLAEIQDRTDGGEGVKIAVFDSYLDTSVPELRGADITQRGDCKGEPSPRRTGEEADHGTAMVTAIVGQGTGNGPGGRGVLGVAPKASVEFYSVEAIHDDGKIDCDGYSVGRKVVEAAERGADVISISLGGGLLGGMDEFITRAWELGAVVVASAGDLQHSYGLIAPPADVPGVVAVGAGDKNAEPWKQNPNPSRATDHYISLISPGADAEIGGFLGAGWTWKSGAVRSGTSGATAIMAGAFGLLAAAYPEATPFQRIQAMVHSSDDSGELAWNLRTGFGIARLDIALQRDPRGWPDENPLQMTPQQAVEAFPASVYDEDAVGDEPKKSSSAEGSGAADDEAPEAAQAAQPAAAATPTDEGDPPVAALAVGGLLGLGVLGGAVLLARRRRTDGT